jgi:hypothetical protein
MIAIQTKPRFHRCRHAALHINFLIHFFAVFQVCETKNENNYAKTARLFQNNFSASEICFRLKDFTQLFVSETSRIQKKFDLNRTAGAKYRRK